MSVFVCFNGDRGEVLDKGVLEYYSIIVEFIEVGIVFFQNRFDAYKDLEMN